MSNTSEAQDQLQKSLFKILDNMHTFKKDKGAIESWITTITINTCLTELRSKKKQIYPIDEVYTDIPFVNDSVIDKLSADEILDQVRLLPEIYREVFNLAVIDGYSHKEIAEMTGIKTASSRSRLTRAKELLRNQLMEIKNKESWAKII